MPLFSNRNDETQELGKTIQNLSDQIGQLSKQLAAKTDEIERLNKELDQARTQGGNATQQTQAAQAEARQFQQQIEQLQRKLADLQAQQTAAPQQADTAQEAEVGAPAAAPAPAASGGLQVGGQAWVTRAGGLPLRLRSRPGLAPDTVLDRLPPGTQMTLLEGPTDADGYSWWHIRTTDGREGWVAGNDLRTQPD